MEVSLIILSSIFLSSIILIYIFYKLGIRQGKQQSQIVWEQNLSRLRREIAEKQRVGIKGKLTETFAPYLHGFPFKPSECKFIGDPVDFLVFEGLDERDIKAIHLVEVKEGKSNLSRHQKQIKDLIEGEDSEKFTFKEFRFKSD